MTGDGDKNITTKQYHCFISYRVATDADIAEKFCDKLQQLELLRERNFRIKVFFDKQSLQIGSNYESGFKGAVESSCLFLPIISKGLLDSIAKLEEGKVDPVLMEYELALKLYTQNNIDIIPLFIGESAVIDGDKVYKRFNEFDTQFPDYSSGSNPSGTIKGTMDAMFKLQGIFINPDELQDKLRIINEKFSNNIWPKYRSNWHKAEELGVEELFTCVQCGMSYLESQNGVGHCMYHEGSNGYRYTCCGEDVGKSRVVTNTVAPGTNAYGQPSMANPSATMQSQTVGTGCRRARHAREHHQRFPYEKFVEWAYHIIGYTDKRTEWDTITCYDYNLNESFEFSIGVCLKGSIRGSIYVKIGSVRTFFALFSKDKLKEIVDAPSDARKTVVEPLEGCIGSIEWLIDDNYEINGILFVGKTSSSAPCEHKYYFTFKPENNNPDFAEMVSHEVVQDGGFEEYGPEKDYDIPTDIYCKGPMLAVRETRQGQTDFKSVGNLAARVKLLDRVMVNVERSYNHGDMFYIPVSLISVSDKPITIVDVSAKWILRGAPDTKWSSSGPVKVKNAEFPFKLDASATQRLDLDVMVENEDKKKLGYNWFGISFTARDHPILILLTFEATTGETISQLYEFVNPRSPLSEKDKNDDHFIPIDNCNTYNRDALRIQYKNEKTYKFSLRFPGRSFEFTDDNLRSIVYKALKNNDSSSEMLNENSFIVHALIDPACKRVFALKATLSSETTSVVAYIPLRPYGNTKDKKSPDSSTSKDNLLKQIPSDYKVMDNTIGKYSEDTIPELPISVQPAAPAAIASDGSTTGGISTEALEKLLGDVESRLIKYLDDKFSKMDERLTSLEEKVTAVQSSGAGAASGSGENNSGRLKKWFK